MDPADAYVQLFDVLKDNTSGDVVIDWSEQMSVKTLTDQTCADVETTGYLPDNGMPANLEATPKALGILLGLDRAFAHAAMDDSFADSLLSYLLVRFRMSGRLNEQTDGTLLFRRTRPSRPSAAPQVLDDLLNLVRIRAPRSEHIHVAWVREENDLPDLDRLHESGQELEGLPPLPIAQLPMLAEKDDLLWNTIDDQYFTVAPRSSRLREELPRALEALDNSGAVIALLPEASLDDGLIEEWRDLLRRVPCPKGSQLTWLLVGTGPVSAVGKLLPDRRPANRAVLLNRRGDLMLTQDKQAVFCFTAEQQQACGVDLGGTRDEYLAQGDEVALLESRYGRFGVLVCEDLGHHLMQGDMIAAGVTHLFVPVLAAAMWEKGWQAQAAQILVQEAGADAAVSNGLAIHDRAPDGSPAPTLLVVSTPSDHDGDRYLRPDEVIHLYASPNGAGPVSARTDALSPRVADW
jgi:hypothetical protein